MYKKQNKIFNFILIHSVLFFGLFFPSKAVTIQTELAKADSLFSLQKYTESFEIYNQIYVENKCQSAQMLMKMTFIKEGLGDFSEALYYLNKYYSLSADEHAQSKMTDIAEEHSLEGFDLTDYTLFKGIIDKHDANISFIVLFIALFLIGIVIYRKFKSKSNAIPYAVSAVILLLSYFWVTNFELNTNHVMIIENHTYLMTGPSAGSDLVAVVKKGHKLEVLDIQAAWTKVIWRENEAYIKSMNVKTLE